MHIAEARRRDTIIEKAGGGHLRESIRKIPAQRCRPPRMEGRDEMMRTPLAGSRLLLLLAIGLLVLEIAAVGLAAPAPAKQAKTASLDTDAHLVGWWKFDDASGTTAARKGLPRPALGVPARGDRPAGG